MAEPTPLPRVVAKAEGVSSNPAFSIERSVVAHKIGDGGTNKKTALVTVFDLLCSLGDGDGDGVRDADTDTLLLASGIHAVFIKARDRAVVRGSGLTRDEKILVVLATLADVARNDPSHLSYVGDFWVSFCLGVHGGRTYKKETLNGYRSSVTAVLSDVMERHGLDRDLAMTVFRNYKTNVNSALREQAGAGIDNFKTVGANAEVAFSFEEYTTLCDAMVRQPENHFFYVLTVLLGNLGCRPSDLDTTSITDLGAVLYETGQRSFATCSMYSLKGRWTKHTIRFLPDQNNVARSALFALSLGLSLIDGDNTANTNFFGALYHSMLVRRVEKMGKTHRQATVESAAGGRGNSPPASQIDKPFKDVLRRELPNDGNNNKNLYSLRKYVQTEVRARLYVYGLGNVLDTRAGWVGDDSVAGELKGRYIQPHDDADMLVGMAAACRLPGTDQADYMADFCWAHSSEALRVAVVSECFSDCIVMALGGVNKLMPHAVYLLLGLALIPGVSRAHHPFDAAIFSRTDVADLLRLLRRVPLQAMPNWGLLYNFNHGWTDYRCVDGKICAPRRQVEEMVCFLEGEVSVDGEDGEEMEEGEEEFFWSDEDTTETTTVVPVVVTSTSDSPNPKENADPAPQNWYERLASDPEDTLCDTKEAFKMPITKDMTAKLQTLWSQWYDEYVSGVDPMEDWDMARIKKLAPKKEYASLKTLVKKKEDAVMNIRRIKNHIKSDSLADVAVWMEEHKVSFDQLRRKLNDI